MSTGIIDQASEVLGGVRVPGRHTFYQLKHFVLGKEVTTQAKMWKCLRELEARLASAKSMKKGIEDAEDDCRMLEIRMDVLEKKKTKGSLHREYRGIQRRKMERQRGRLVESICEMKRRLEETEEEMNFFLGAYRQLESIEPLCDHDDPESNARYWDQNFSQELQLRIMLQRPLDLELVRSILALDDGSEARREMIGIIEQVQRQAIASMKGSRIEKRGAEG